MALLKKASPNIKRFTIAFAIGRWRIVRRQRGRWVSYVLQVREMSSTAEQNWATIEVYDYFYNARAIAKAAHHAMDGGGAFRNSR